MKPGPSGKHYSMRITGRELLELQRFTWSMAEAFDLDRRIEHYKGTRPLRLYRWDLDCLEDVTAMALEDKTAYPGKSGEGYRAMRVLHERIKRVRKQAYAELGRK